MKLNLQERLVAMSILPKEGSFLTLRILRDLIAKLGVSAQEFKEFEIAEDRNEEGKGVIKWGKKGFEEKEISLGEKEKDLIVDALKNLNDSKKLTTEHFSLYEKFMEKKE